MHVCVCVCGGGGGVPCVFEELLLCVCITYALGVCLQSWGTPRSVYSHGGHLGLSTVMGDI